jgi:hypothetical protein
MFDFVRLVARPIIKKNKTLPPESVGTPSLLAAFRGVEFELDLMDPAGPGTRAISG